MHVTWIKCFVYEHAIQRKTWNNSKLPCKYYQIIKCIISSKWRGGACSSKTFVMDTTQLRIFCWDKAE